MTLAASSGTSTGTIILGIVLLLLFLAFLYWLVRWIFRLIAWPFRAMRRPKPTGLGGDYEQMVRSQPQVVIPQSRRTRQPEPERRLPFPPQGQQLVRAPEASVPSRSAEPVPPSGQTVFRSRASRRWSWILSVLASLLVVGTVTSIISPFAGLTMQDAVSGAVLLFVIAPWWIWSWRRGRLPVIRVGSAGAAEAAAFREWSAARASAELAEFEAWRAARNAGNVQPASPAEPPSAPPMIDTF